MKSLPTRERGLKSAVMPKQRFLADVAPYAGAWIEMMLALASAGMAVSLPTRERGLKFSWHHCLCLCHRVAPYAGAWIEMPSQIDRARSGLVAPYAGAWIEIFPSECFASKTMSLPTRERGLKCLVFRPLSTSRRRSLPTRERGLKSRITPGIRERREGSLPTRERGLK